MGLRRCGRGGSRRPPRRRRAGRRRRSPPSCSRPRWAPGTARGSALRSATPPTRPTTSARSAGWSRRRRLSRSTRSSRTPARPARSAQGPLAPADRADRATGAGRPARRLAHAAGAAGAAVRRSTPPCFGFLLRGPPAPRSRPGRCCSPTAARWPSPVPARGGVRHQARRPARAGDRRGGAGRPGAALARLRARRRSGWRSARWPRTSTTRSSSPWRSARSGRRAADRRPRLGAAASGASRRRPRALGLAARPTVSGVRAQHLRAEQHHPHRAAGPAVAARRARAIVPLGVLWDWLGLAVGAVPARRSPWLWRAGRARAGRALPAHHPARRGAGDLQPAGGRGARAPARLPADAHDLDGAARRPAGVDRAGLARRGLRPGRERWRRGAGARRRARCCCAAVAGATPSRSLAHPDAFAEAERRESTGCGGRAGVDGRAPAGRDRSCSPTPPPRTRCR